MIQVFSDLIGRLLRSLLLRGPIISCFLPSLIPFSSYKERGTCLSECINVIIKVQGHKDERRRWRKDEIKLG